MIVNSVASRRPSNALLIVAPRRHRD